MDPAQNPGPGRVYARIDSNSCYCSCERAFQPKLAHQPVIVLSNNDGFYNRARAVKLCLALAPC